LACSASRPQDLPVRSPRRGGAKGAIRKKEPGCVPQASRLRGKPLSSLLGRQAKGLQARRVPCSDLAKDAVENGAHGPTPVLPSRTSRAARSSVWADGLFGRPVGRRRLRWFGRFQRWLEGEGVPGGRPETVRSVRDQRRRRRCHHGRDVRPSEARERWRESKGHYHAAGAHRCRGVVEGRWHQLGGAGYL